MDRYSIEREFKVYNDDCGEFVSVTKDADGLDLVELRQYDNTGKVIARITMTKEQATLFLQVFREYMEVLTNGPA